MSGYSYVRIGQFAISGNSTPNVLIALNSYGGNIDTTPFHPHDPEYPPVSEDKATRLYLTALVSNPVYFFKQRLSALWELWGFWPSVREASAKDIGSVRRDNLMRVILGLRFPLILLALFGFVKSGKEAADFFLITPALVLTVVHTVLFAEPRFTVPAEPLLIVLAIEGIYYATYKILPAGVPMKIFGRFAPDSKNQQVDS